MALVFDDKQYKALPENKRSLYLLQWLQRLPGVIKNTTRADLKKSHSSLVSQLTTQLGGSLGPQLRRALGQAFVALYTSGETFSLHTTVGKCCDIIRTKEDQSNTSNKLCAIECLGSIYKHHGRMAGTLFHETVQVLVKAMKPQDYRLEILHTLRQLLIGLGPSSSSAHKDIYKCIKNGLSDRSMAVRSAAAKCALELSNHSSFLYSNELDSFSNNCIRALDGSDYDVRCSVAKLLGTLLALTQKPLPPNMKGKLKLPSLDDVLLILSNGFVKGASGFLKSGGPDLLKSSSASREVRVGITQTYIIFLTEMGGGWVERNLPVITKHILELVSHPRTISTHIDAVYSRKCISFILRSVFGRLLGESAQFLAAKHLCQFVSQTVASSHPQPPRHQSSKENLSEMQGSTATGEREKDRDRDKEKDRFSLQQHMVICAVLEIGALVFSLNTAALPLVTGESGGGTSAQELIQKKPPFLSAINGVLLHQLPAPRLAAAWCMFCVGLALPSQLSTLVDFCLIQLKGSRKSVVAVSGYSYATAALLGTVRSSELGLPSSKAKEVFRFAQELIASGMKEEESKDQLGVMNIQAGWALVGAFISLGSVYVRSQLRPLLTSWRGAFPHSVKEMTTEQAGGSLHSWTITLENRTGALTSIASFLKFCSDLISPEVTRRLMLPLDSALAMLSGLSGLAKTHGVQIKASGAMLRLRLYQSLALLPPDTYEGSLSALLRELVSEFTLTDNLASTTTSLLRSMCHHDDSILHSSWLEETDHKDVEEQLQPNSAAGSGALEHDAASVFMTDTKGTKLPGPLPLGVAVIDSAIILFGKAFPAVAPKHRVQLLTHFRECIKQAKSSRQQAIQINIFTAFLAALKNLVETKSVLGSQELLTNAYGLIAGALANAEPILRCAAGEALGRMSQVGGDTNFVAQIAQTSFEALKSTRDHVTRTGHSLVLGCLHRYVGGMGSGQHLQMSVSLLHQLSEDMTSPTLQVWGLHALALIADSGGPMFRNYVESTLNLMLRLLMTTPSSCVTVYQCLGKCLSALITTLGPELQDTSTSMNTTRTTCLTCCTIIQEHPDAIVQSAAIGCLQQLQLFAPQYVSLPSIVPRLSGNLNSPHLLLRRAAANCLRQFAQREPKTIWTITLNKANNKGLEHTVLSKLDAETDAKLCEDLGEILFSLLTSLAPEDPMKWLLLCNGVLSDSGSKAGGLAGGSDVGGARGGAKASAARDDGQQAEDEDEDAARFTTGESEESQRATKISPRWPTKVFAVECSRKIYAVCKSDPAHFDLTLAQNRKSERGGDYLVMHLSELVRTSFIAATASVDQLKLAGYEALRDVIGLFAATPDPDYPGHVLLEQYQAQIGAALRPAFTSETAPHVTSMACQVCSQWLGSGVSRDLGDLKRVQQLLVSSLKKISKEREETSIYGEAVATMESLAVLKAWAELYIKVSDQQTIADDFTFTDEDTDSSQSSGAMELLDPHLPGLSQYWLAALKDQAYLSLPPQFITQLPPSGGTFYSNDVMDCVKPYYQDNWPSFLHAAAMWLASKGFTSLEKSSAEKGKSLPQQQQPPPPQLIPQGSQMLPPGVSTGLVPRTDARHDYFHLVLGLAVQSLCIPATLDEPQTVAHCLRAIKRLFKANFSHELLASDSQLSIEVLSVMHRILLTCQSKPMHTVALEIALLLGEALKQSAESPPTPAEVDGSDNNISTKFTLESSLEPGKSCVYALLEVSACCLLSLIPDLKPKDSAAGTTMTTTTFTVAAQPPRPLTSDENIVISHAIKVVVLAASLCAPEAIAQCLPSILHLLLSALQYASKHASQLPAASLSVASGLQNLKQLVSTLPLSHKEQGGCLLDILRSALASVLGVGMADDVTGGSGDYSDMDKETRLLVMAVLVLSPTGGGGVCLPGSTLFTSSVELCKTCLQSEQPKLQLKALQTCKSLFQKQDPSEVNIHFIHALGPEIVRLVESSGTSRGNGRRAPPEPPVVIEASQVLETLLSLTAEANKTEMMGLLLPLYISLLIDPASTPITQHQRQIHSYTLQQVTQIGPKYPAAFRSMMQSSPALKQKLEAAVRAGQAAPGKVGGGRGQAAGSRMQQQQQPSIKLKMDFSNFK